MLLSWLHEENLAQLLVQKRLLQNNSNGLVLLHWHCSELPAGILLLCLGSAGPVGRFGHPLILVPLVNTSSAQRQAFSVVALFIWNALPLDRSLKEALYKFFESMNEWLTGGYTEQRTASMPDILAQV